MILTEFFRTLKRKEDFEIAVLENVSIKQIEGNPFFPLEITMDDPTKDGTIYFAIAEDYLNYSNSKVFWDFHLPLGTSLTVEVSIDESEWIEIERGGELPFYASIYYFRIIFKSEGIESPIFYAFHLSMWEEIERPNVEYITKPKDLTKDLIQLYDLKGEMVAYLENAKNPITEEDSTSKDIFTFSMPFTDPKTKLINYDCEVVFKNKRYVITDIVDGMDESGVYLFDVTCELVYIDLLTDTINDEMFIDLKTPDEGLEILLQGTSWEKGQVLNDQKVYSIREMKKSRLWFIQQWAKMTNKKIEWDSMNRKISLVTPRTNKNKTSFRYRKNLKSIKRKVTPPVATVVYGYGKNGISFESINGGIPYVENFDWYVQQGVPLELAREKYRKEYIWKDERYLYMANLRDASIELVDTLSKPSISYECKVIDLSVLTGRKEDSFFIGDVVEVENEDLGILTENEVVRIKRYHHEPWKNEVELGILRQGLEASMDSNSQSMSDEIHSAQPSTIFATNELLPISVGTQPIIALEMAFTNFATSHAQIGLTIIGEATEDATLSIRFAIGGKHVWNTIKHRIFEGYNTISTSFLIEELPEGSDDFRVELVIDKGIFLIQQKGAQIFINGANLLGGSFGGNNPNINLLDYINKTDSEYDEMFRMNFDMDVGVEKTKPIPITISDMIWKKTQEFDDIMEESVNITLIPK